RAAGRFLLRQGIRSLPAEGSSRLRGLVRREGGVSHLLLRRPRIPESRPIFPGRKGAEGGAVLLPRPSACNGSVTGRECGKRPFQGLIAVGAGGSGRRPGRGRPVRRSPSG